MLHYVVDIFQRHNKGHLIVDYMCQHLIDCISLIRKQQEKIAMREFAKVSPQIWISERGKEIKRLGIESQLIAFYLSTNPHAVMIGIYYLPIAFIAHETGVSHEKVIESLRKLADIDYCTYDESSEYIWVHDMGFEQLSSKLKINDNRVKAINDAINSLPKLPFLDKFLERYAVDFHIVNLNHSIPEGPSKPLQSKEKENENENENNNEKNNNNETTKTDYYFNDFENKNLNKPFSGNDLSNVKEQAKRILDFFNEKIKEPYPHLDENLQVIINRLNEGYTEKVCFQVITRKHRHWKDNTVMKPYFQLHVIFGKKFSKYVKELPITMTKR